MRAYANVLKKTKSQAERKLKKEKGKKKDKKSDAEQAREKAAKIREQGLQKYKEQLLIELVNDKRRKLTVVYFLCFITLMFVAFCFYTLNDLNIDDVFEMIIKAASEIE